VLRHYDSAIDHHIQLSAKHLIDLFWVIIEAFVGLGDTGGNDGMPQLPHEGKGDCIVRNPDPHGLLVCQHDLGDQFGGLQNKGIGSGYEGLHGSVGVIGDIGVIADIFQICADDAQSFGLDMPFQMVDLFNGIFLVKIAPEAIDGIGGIGNNPSLLKGVCHLTDEPLLWIFRVYFDDHTFDSLNYEGFLHILFLHTFRVLLYPHHCLGDIERVITYLLKVGEHVYEDKPGVNLAYSFVEPLYVLLSHGVF
jgi:hypothetical protein